MDILSLCSGIGGLDLAVEQHFGGKVKILSEIDSNAFAVLDKRFPDAENIGDWTAIDTFDGFDVVCGGLPCQPVSVAGKGKGSKDERYLYDDFIRILAAGDMRPAIVLENVRGLMHTRFSELFWKLIRGLADLGYVGQYGVVRASDAGAPHKRERWFCIATHRECVGWRERSRLGKSQSPAFGWDGFGDYDRTAFAHTGGLRSELRRITSAMDREATAARLQTRKSNKSGSPVGDSGGSPPNPNGLSWAPRDNADLGAGDFKSGDDSGGRNENALLPTPTSRDGKDGTRNLNVPVNSMLGRTIWEQDWGKYSAAIARWEQVIGRPPPSPKNESNRLNPDFVEWMMGFPEGWVSGLDIPHKGRLRLLGNAVVPQQAILALSLLESSP